MREANDNTTIQSQTEIPLLLLCRFTLFRRESLVVFKDEILGSSLDTLRYLAESTSNIKIRRCRQGLIQMDAVIIDEATGPCRKLLLC